MEKLKTVNKHGYRKPPNGYEIEGMDIQIDENTQKLCETYNQSSGATRGVLYLLLVVTAISVIAVFNSNWKFNWDKERIALFSKNIFKDDSIAKRTKDSLNLENSIRVRKDSLNKEKIQYKSSYYKFPSSDSIKRSIKRDFDEQSLNGFIKANIDNNDAVKVSIIGVTIDVNDLASISGITLIMLLVVLRFTVTREKHNLKIAFNSINERYNDGADYFKLRSEYFKIKRTCWV